MSDQGRGLDSPRGNRASGPGAITPDGCAVDLYALLPPGREPEIIHIAAGSAVASILELGSGTGRVTDALVKIGHPVVAVDESPEMLAHVRSAETSGRASRILSWAALSMLSCSRRIFLMFPMRASGGHCCVAARGM